MSRTPSKISEPSPTCGEHNDEILADIGLSDVEISNLRDKDII
jgi:crotonobetainyl-CoA:carnitine CoA-transferase CaiB-like acyl-CoA transferase